MYKNPSTPSPTAPLIVEAYRPEPRISHKKHPVLMLTLALAGAFAIGRYTAGDSEEKTRKEAEKTAEVQKKLEARQCILDLLIRTSRSTVTPSRDLLNGDLSNCESIVRAVPAQLSENR